MYLIWETIIVCIIWLVSADIQLNVYNNSVLEGEATNIISLNTLSHSIPYKNEPFSAQILGSITWPNSVNKYYIKCEFDKGLLAIVKIDDHLICAPGIYPDKTFEFWNLTWTASAYTTRTSFIRIDMYSNVTNNPSSLAFNIVWSFNNDSSFNTINGTYLTTNISLEQQQRMILQNSLSYNTFSTWFTGNMLTIVRMPDSFGLTFGVCDGNNSTKCVTQQFIEDNNLWVGVHSYDHTYYEYNLTYNGYNIQYQFSSVVQNKTYSNFYAKISLLSTKTPLPYIAFSSRFYWNRYGNINSINNKKGYMNCFMNFKGYGLSQSFDICSNINSTKKDNNNILFRFDTDTGYNAIYFTTDTANIDTDDIDEIITKYKNLEYSTYDKYGIYNDTKRGIQSGLMWNLIYTPEESGPFNPVARAWSDRGTTTDFGMVIFDWDNIFASYQLSLDALNLSITNLIQV
eukprot:135021_1